MLHLTLILTQPISAPDLHPIWSQPYEQSVVLTNQRDAQWGLPCVNLTEAKSGVDTSALLAQVTHACKQLCIIDAGVNWRPVLDCICAAGWRQLQKQSDRRSDIASPDMCSAPVPAWQCYLLQHYVVYLCTAHRCSHEHVSLSSQADSKGLRCLSLIIFLKRGAAASESSSTACKNVY